MPTLVRIVPVACLAFALGCQADPRSPHPTDLGARTATWIPDSAATLAVEYSSGLYDAAGFLVSDVSTWTNVWAQVYSGRQPKPALPPVDFEAERVIVVALGERSSGGYAIRIDSLVAFEQGTVVYVTGRAPGDRCGVTMALTQPAHLVRAPTPLEPLIFERQTVVHDCG
jgi:hypothetical protein